MKKLVGLLLYADHETKAEAQAWPTANLWLSPPKH